MINVEKGPLWVTFTAALDIRINLNIKNIVMIIRKCCLWRHLTSFGSLSYPVGKGGADSCWPGASTWTTAKCWVISCMSSKLNSVLKHDLSASQENNKDTSQILFHKSLSKKEMASCVPESNACAYFAHSKTPPQCLVSITVTCFFCFCKTILSHAVCTVNSVCTHVHVVLSSLCINVYFPPFFLIHLFGLVYLI